MNVLTLTFLILSFTLSLFSADKALKPEQYPFSFSKPLGKIDKNSAQRGLQVYIEVCASCHGLKHVAYRSLEGLGYKKVQKIIQSCNSTNYYINSFCRHTTYPT